MHIDFDAALVAELKAVHQAHTILLYGSRARGDATDESDIDVACYADAATETTRDARLWRGMYLDAFIHPTAHATAEPDVDALKMLGGRPLLDARGLAGSFLEKLAALEARGPAALPESELEMRRVWARKMLARIRRGDVEALYRRHWLLYQLLEDHFALRGAWYRGPKRALADLRATAPTTFAKFEQALALDAPMSALDALVDEVVGLRS